MSGGFTRILNQTGRAGLILTPSIGATSLAVRFDAIAGDANLDAVVNFADLVTLAQNYGELSGHNWLSGDFNGSGGVDFTDLVSLAQHYNSGTTQAGSLEATFASDWALAQSL